MKLYFLKSQPLGVTSYKLVTCNSISHMKKHKEPFAVNILISYTMCNIVIVLYHNLCNANANICKYM